jgi:hypothetical protein
VADDDVEVGEAIKNSRDDQAQEVEAVFGVPAPTGDGEKRASVAGEVSVVGLLNDGRRGRGVEVEWDAEGFGGFEDGEELGRVEEFAIGGAVDVEAFEAKGVDAALELFDGGGGIFEAGGGEGSEAVRVGGDGGG